jgi:hypothetical protein
LGRAYSLYLGMEIRSSQHKKGSGPKEYVEF